MTYAELYKQTAVHVVHHNIIDGDAVENAAVYELQSNARQARVVYHAIGDGDIFKSANAGCSEFNTVRFAFDDAVGDSQIFYAEIRISFGTNGVVAAIEVTIGHYDIVTINNIQTVVVGNNSAYNRNIVYRHRRTLFQLYLPCCAVFQGKFFQFNFGAGYDNDSLRPPFRSVVFVAYLKIGMVAASVDGSASRYGNIFLLIRTYQ